MIHISFISLASPKGSFYERLGKEIAAARNKQRLTQERLANAANLSRTSVTNIEKGRQIVPVHILVRFAETLGVSLQDLIPVEDTAESNTVQRRLASLEPDKQSWARRLLGETVPQLEQTNESTTLRHRPTKGSRADRKGGNPKTTSSGRKASRTARSDDQV